MTMFRIVFGVDLLIIAFTLWQWAEFLTSELISTTPDGTRTVASEAPGTAWLVASPLLFILVLTAGVLGGATLLHRRGRTGLATLLLLVPAVPIVLGGLLMFGLMILFTVGTPSH